MHRHVLSLALLLAVATPALADDPVVTIILKDAQFVPSEVPVPARVKVQLVIQNQGPANAEFESTSLHREKIVAPGSQISVFVGPLEPGSYEFFDDFHATTRGHLIVK